VTFFKHPTKTVLSIKLITRSQFFVLGNVSFQAGSWYRTKFYCTCGVFQIYSDSMIYPGLFPLTMWEPRYKAKHTPTTTQVSSIAKVRTLYILHADTVCCILLVSYSTSDDTHVAKFHLYLRDACRAARVLCNPRL